jgi:uncharacterized phage-associated protein
MIPYQKEKIENAICFFASEHQKKSKKPLYQTFLYKYLAFLDFESLRKTGRPCLGLSYKAMDRGPVPIEIYDQRAKIQSLLFEFRKVKDDIYTVLPKRKPNLDYFSKKEISRMRKLIEIYAKNYISSKLISDATHESIKAWKKTWKSHPNDIIDYKLEFDDDLLNKKEEELTYPEESYLIYRTFET